MLDYFFFSFINEVRTFDDTLGCYSIICSFFSIHLNVIFFFFIFFAIPTWTKIITMLVSLTQQRWSRVWRGYLHGYGVSSPSESFPSPELLSRRLFLLKRPRVNFGGGRGSIPNTLWICLNAISLSACCEQHK
jgi:hypothetical protein